MGTAKGRLRWRWRKANERREMSAGPTRNGNSAYVYVFYLGNEDLHKIGMSGNYDARLKALRASNPNLTVKLAYRMTHAKKCETYIHHKFKSQRVEREIYRLSEDDIAAIRKFLEDRQPPGYSLAQYIHDRDHAEIQATNAVQEVL